MRAAFDVAVQQHGQMVLRVCRAVLGPGADADDAWSETFLSALRAWPNLPEDTDVEAWLVRVAHRRAVDVIRRSARSAAPVGAAVDLRERAGGERAAGRHEYDDDDNADRLDAHRIWEAVATLPSKQRMCVAYRFLGGLRHAEIAELVGGSEAAARRAAADGVAALRRMMETERTS